jgi:carbonic anhydrase
MRRLLHGIHAFQQDVFPSVKIQFEQLAAGQSPSTLFITCSDSRIVPHLLTQTEPGELFVLRNAGNIVPPYSTNGSGEAATIEYAIKVLQVSDIIICGHSHCGAMAGLLRPESLQDLPAVRRWLSHAQETFRAFSDLLPESGADADIVTAASQHNVAMQLSHLRTHPSVAEAEAAGQLSLHGCFYRFETGETFVLNEQTHSFLTIQETLDSRTSLV